MRSCHDKQNVHTELGELFQLRSSWGRTAFLPVDHRCLPYGRQGCYLRLREAKPLSLGFKAFMQAHKNICTMNIAWFKYLNHNHTKPNLERPNYTALGAKKAAAPSTEQLHRFTSTDTF